MIFKPYIYEKWLKNFFLAFINCNTEILTKSIVNNSICKVELRFGLGSQKSPLQGNFKSGFNHFHSACNMIVSHHLRRWTLTLVCLLSPKLTPQND